MAQSELDRESVFKLSQIKVQIRQTPRRRDELIFSHTAAPIHPAVGTFSSASSHQSSVGLRDLVAGGGGGVAMDRKGDRGKPRMETVLLLVKVSKA